MRLIGLTFGLGRGQGFELRVKVRAKKEKGSHTTGHEQIKVWGSTTPPFWHVVGHTHGEAELSNTGESISIQKPASQVSKLKVMFLREAQLKAGSTVRVYPAGAAVVFKGKVIRVQVLVS